jgi:hypothetical protein
MVTGEVFYGQNTRQQPRNLSEPLPSRANAQAEANQAASPAPEGLPAGWSRREGIPGSHSEVQAVDQALRARPEAGLEDIAIYNVRTEDVGVGQAPTMPRCRNCRAITDGVIPLTD